MGRQGGRIVAPELVALATHSRVAASAVDTAGTPEPRSGHHFEMGHHAGGMVLENVAVVHPTAFPIIRHPGDANCRAWRDIHDVLPRPPGGRLAVYRHNLKEETVQVKRMVHQR